MRPEPELLVPVSEAREMHEQPAPRHPRWLVVLARLWIVLALGTGWLVLIAGDGPVHFKAAALTVAGFAIVWALVGWIFGPVASGDEQR